MAPRRVSMLQGPVAATAVTRDGTGPTAATRVDVDEVPAHSDGGVSRSSERLCEGRKIPAQVAREAHGAVITRCAGGEEQCDGGLRPGTHRVARNSLRVGKKQADTRSQCDGRPISGNPVRANARVKSWPPRADRVEIGRCRSKRSRRRRDGAQVVDHDEDYIGMRLARFAAQQRCRQHDHQAKYAIRRVGSPRSRHAGRPGRLFPVNGRAIPRSKARTPRSCGRGEASAVRPFSVRACFHAPPGSARPAVPSGWCPKI